MKIGLISLGCPKNLVDGEVMLGLARQAGHELTRDAADADVLVVNTCAFIDRAKQESIDAILEMAELKKAAPSRRLVVTGCLAERYRDELTGPDPGDRRGARHGRGAADCQRARRPSRACAGARRLADGVPPAGSPQRAPAPRRAHASCRPTSTMRTRRAILATPRHYAYVKIAEGCDYKCAFCIIPRLRGQYRSRPAASIVTEARRLAAAGVRELILISQDTTFYGIDRSERGALARLLRELNAVDGLEWIRLLYLYPTTIDDAMLDAMAECDKVVKYIDLPLQHASDAVLKRMRRPGTRAGYERLLGRIRDRVPGRHAPHDVHRRLSRRNGCGRRRARGSWTPSGSTTSVSSPTRTRRARRPGPWTTMCPARVKRQRRDRLMRQQKRIVRAAQKRRIGERVRLVVDGAVGGARAGAPGPAGGPGARD